VIFLDVKMADLEGFSATRRLAEDQNTADIPVIVVTASAFGDTQQAAKEAGSVAYLPKPVRAEALFTALQTHVGAEFVRNDEDAQVHGAPLADTGRHPGLAERLREAVDIGDIGHLHAIADELVSLDGAGAALGQRIARLATSFDFDGVRELAATLTGEQGRADAD
jgi:response regulator RpfG family c-di-GMP phosphodiesterase